MRHKGGRPNHLDSAGMPFFARSSSRRGRWPALLLFAVAVPFLAGCAEDRGNLIPQDTSQSVIEKLNEVDSLAAEGHCFKAQEVALSAQDEIENLGGEFDRELKRSLIDGVVRLQAMLGDGEFCVDAGEPPPDEPEVIEEDPEETEGTTGATGTTDSTGNTGGQDENTDEDQNSDQPQGNENGQTPPDTPANPTRPTNPTTPTTPTNPPSGPGSGGLGPG